MAEAALAEAMQVLAAAMTEQTRQQEAAAQNRPAPVDSVKIPLFDGRTDVEDFIALFEHVGDLYEWADHIKTAKLKTSLQGSAMECSRPNEWLDIYAALRARFGITEAEAKRSLLSMKSGQHDKLKELADRIHKLMLAAYPTLDAAMRGTLALDQFKRCVSTDLSLFLVSRPPANLDEAVAISGEYLSANPRGRRMQLSAAEVDAEMEINAFESSTLTKKDLQTSLTGFQKSMADFMKGLMTSCAQAIQQGVKQSSDSSARSTQKKEFGRKPQATSTDQRRGPPPNPCYLCKEMHWFKDCPQRRDQQSPPARFNSKQGNGSRPQQ